MKYRKHIVAVALTATILVTTNGCSLINPHVSWDSVAEAKRKEMAHAKAASKSPEALISIDRSANMEDAVAYADRAIGAYKRGMGDQATLNSMTGVVLIPIAANIIRLGIDGGHSTTITNLTAGAGAGYGVSTWLSNPTRSEIYVAGILAVNCAKEVMLPYYVSDTWMSEFSTALAELTTQGSTLTMQLAQLDALTSALERLTSANDFQVKEAKALADSVASLLAATAVTRQNGVVLKRRLELAGQALVYGVDRIAGEVDKALLSTVPSLTALPGVIASLSPAVDMFRQAPTLAVSDTRTKVDTTVTIGAQSSVREKPVTKMARTALMNIVQEVRKTVTRLASAEGIVRAAVEDFDQPISPSALAQCGVSADDIIKPLRVLPSNSIVMKVGETKSVFLTGGSGQYAAIATGEVKGLTVSQPVPLGEAVRIVTTTETPPSKTNVLVKDVAGQTAIIELTIAAAKQGGTNGDPESNGTSVTTFEKGLGLNDIRQIQTALRICNDPSDLKIDGDLKKNTRAAAKKCPQVGSESLDKDKVNALKDEYLVDGLPKAGRVTMFERQATKPDLMDVYAMLGISPVPASGNLDDWFTKNFRTKLKEFQKKHDGKAEKSNKIGISGLYTKEFPE